MRRTRRRPFVTGALRPGRIWIAAIVLLIAVPVATSAIAINIAAAAYVLLGAFTYGVVYTVWLKRRHTGATSWHAVALVLLSILLLHSFVHTVGFAGQEEPAGEEGFARTFLSCRLAGYGIALLVSLYILWTFERTDGALLAEIVNMTIVLGFPAAIGAAVAPGRLAKTRIGKDFCVLAIHSQALSGAGGADTPWPG